MLHRIFFPAYVKVISLALSLETIFPFLPADLFEPIRVFFIKVAILICTGISIFLWQFNRLLLSLGLLMALFNDILVTYVFRTGIATIGGILRVEVLPLVFTLAVFVMGVTYTLSAFFAKELNLVDWKKAAAWLLGAILFYTAGADVFAGSEAFRRGLGGFMYSRLLGVEVDNTTDCVGKPLQNLIDPDTGQRVTASQLLGRFNFSGASADLQMDCLRNHFGEDFRTDTSIDGIDVAMSYLYASDDDFFTADRALPKGYYSASRGQLYGFEERFYPYFDNLDDLEDEDEANEVLGKAANGIQRMFFGIFLIVFGIVEQYIFLIISIAVGIIFFLLLFALLLAFFNHTEFVATSILQQWMSMMITSLFVSILQATALFILLLSTISLNPLIPLGASVISIALVLLAAKTATDAVMGIIGAFASSVASAASIVTKGTVGAGYAAARGAYGAANFASRGALGRGMDKAGSAMSSSMESARSKMKGASDWWYKRNRGGGEAPITPATTGIDSVMKPQRGSRVAISMHREQSKGSPGEGMRAAFGTSQEALKSSAGMKTISPQTGAGDGKKTPSPLTPPKMQPMGNLLKPQTTKPKTPQSSPKVDIPKSKTPTQLRDAQKTQNPKWQPAKPKPPSRPTSK